MASVANIKKSLILQLKNKGANVDHFTTLVDDFIWFHQEEMKMRKELEEIGGHMLETKTTSKLHPLSKNAKEYNDHKLKVLKQLGLEAKNVADDPDDDL